MPIIAGQKLVLFFYPRADTPGCTREAIDFTRLKDAFAESGTAVLGISADTVKAQESFRNKHELSIPLISDEKHEMLEAYGAWGEKSMYGRTFLGILRTTVLIGNDGKIAKIWRNVRVDGHADEVLAAAHSRLLDLVRFHFPKINHEWVKSASQIEPYGTPVRPARECRCRTVPVIIPSITTQHHHPHESRARRPVAQAAALPRGQ